MKIFMTPILVLKYGIPRSFILHDHDEILPGIDPASLSSTSRSFIPGRINGDGLRLRPSVSSLGLRFDVDTIRILVGWSICIEAGQQLMTEKRLNTSVDIMSRPASCESFKRLLSVGCNH